MIDIKSARKSLGMSQSELARAIDAHPMTISMWERGERTPERQAERLINLLIELDSKGLLPWYRKQFMGDR